MVLSNKQKEYIRNAHHRYNLKIGARRCGKTYLDDLYVIPRRILKRKGKDGLVVILGVTRETIERNVLEPLRKIYGPSLVTTINSRNIAILFGERVYCLGAEKLSQVSKIQGSSIKYCYCDELAKFNKEVFEMIKSSLDRSYSCLDGALNPESKRHWLKKDFLDTIEEKGLDVYVQHYTIFDNPFLDKEVVENMCKEYQGTVYYNRLILGQWCNAEGLIFKQIADNRNRYLTNEDIEGTLSVGIDWGGNGSAHSITATMISTDYRKIKVLASDLYNATGTDTKDLFRWIINFLMTVIVKYGRIDVIFCDSAEQVLINTLITELEINNIHTEVKNSVKTEIKNRIEAINILLNLDRLLFERDKTETIIEALQTAMFDEKAKEDRWLDDGTSDIDSLDSFNYSIEYWFPQLMRVGG